MSADYLASRLWFVRRKGQILGPFSITEIKKLCDRGNLAGFDDVSEDKRSWGSVDSLFAALAPVKPVQTGTDPDVVPVHSPVVSFGARDYRLVSIGIGLLTFGQLFEILAGLCITVMFFAGNPVVMTVFSFLYIAMALAYHFLLNLGYGFASSGNADIAPRALPVTNLILHIVDFLLDAVLMIMWAVVGTMPIISRDGFGATRDVASIVSLLIVCSRIIMWIPMTVICIEWLKAISRRAQEYDSNRSLAARSIIGQASYFYMVCAVRYLVLMIIGIIVLLAGDHLSEKQRLSLQITGILYLLVVTAVACWRTGLLFVAWRMTSSKNTGF